MPTKKRRIYTLPNTLSAEKKIVTFAKCSRSPKSFDEIAKELTDEKSKQFNKRWVVGFGHLSVAEHGILSIAMENISIIATKFIEDNRLASYTEKSTRYQIFDKNCYYKPKVIMKSTFGKVYEETADYLFEIYLRFYPIVNEYVKKKFPKPKNMDNFIYESTCKSKTCDVVRYLLPVSTLTNFGFTVNARSLLHAIEKLLAHPMEEMREIGQDLKKIAKKEIPTLSQMAKPSKYFGSTVVMMDKFVSQKFKGAVQKSEAVKLVEFDKNAEDRIITAIIYRFSNKSYQQIKKEVKKMSQREKEKIFTKFLSHKGQLEAPLRELEHTNYTFDILMDYGGYRDLERHRICTQTNQLITGEHGFEVPQEIIDLGLKNSFIEACKKSAQAYRKIAQKFPYEAQNVVAMAFKKRTLFSMNLREVYHLVSLRTRPAGHISYRRIAYQMFEEVKKVHPILAKYIHVVKVEPRG